jgi:hypothetical protein
MKVDKLFKWNFSSNLTVHCYATTYLLNRAKPKKSSMFGYKIHQINNVPPKTKQMASNAE